MPSQRILFTSDLHSRRELYAELARLAQAVRPDLVVLGGDLFEGGPAVQAAFARGPAAQETLQRLRDAGVQRVAILPGNDDWDAALEALRERDTGGFVHGLADAALELEGGINVLGYAFVPLTPYTVKEHEKLDHFRPDKQDVLEAIASGVASHDGTVGGVTRAVDGSDSIERDLLALAPQVRPGRTIFVSHCPPRRTQLDLVLGRHAGSQALRDFLIAARPAVSLHGHLPEIAARHNVFAEWVGETLAVNPGQGPRLHAVRFVAERPAATLEHNVLGPWVDPRTSADR
jgi:Icc-related predicted phosphoesterase